MLLQQTLQELHKSTLDEFMKSQEIALSAAVSTAVSAERAAANASASAAAAAAAAAIAEKETAASHKASLDAALAAVQDVQSQIQTSTFHAAVQAAQSTTDTLCAAILERVEKSMEAVAATAEAHRQDSIKKSDRDSVCSKVDSSATYFSPDEMTAAVSAAVRDAVASLPPTSLPPSFPLPPSILTLFEETTLGKIQAENDRDRALAELDDLRAAIGERDGGRSKKIGGASSLHTSLRDAFLRLVVFLPRNSSSTPMGTGVGASSSTPSRGVPHTALRVVRDWAPLGPLPSSSANETAGLGSSPDVPFTAHYFTDLASASAAVGAASEKDGFTAWVPLPAASAIQNELASAERMLEAYHKDNQRLLLSTAKAMEELDALKSSGKNEGFRKDDAPVNASPATPSVPWDETLRVYPPTSAGNEVLVSGRPEGGALIAAVPATSDDATTQLSQEINRLKRELSEARESERESVSRVRDEARAKETELREDSRRREIELGVELEKARRARAEMEGKAAGIDISRLPIEGAELAKVKTEAAINLAEKDRELSTIREKLAWYRENQAIIDADASTIAAQADTIRELQAKLRAACAQVGSLAANSRLSTPRVTSIGEVGTSSNYMIGGVAMDRVDPQSASSPNHPSYSITAPTLPSATKKPPFPAPRQLKRTLKNSNPSMEAPLLATNVSTSTDPLSLANKRINSLTAKLAAAEEALAKRVTPGSLESLIREAKGASGAVGEPSVLAAEVRRLSDAAVEREAAAERGLRALRQEHERGVSTWEAREKSLREEVALLKARLSALGETEDSDFISALETGLGVGPDEKGAIVASISAVSKRELGLRSRIKELELELERVRNFYAKKIKSGSTAVGEDSREPPRAATHSSSHASSRKGTPTPASTRPASRNSTAQSSRRVSPNTIGNLEHFKTVQQQDQDQTQPPASSSPVELEEGGSPTSHSRPPSVEQLLIQVAQLEAENRELKTASVNSLTASHSSGVSPLSTAALSQSSITGQTDVELPPRSSSSSPPNLSNTSSLLPNASLRISSEAVSVAPSPPSASSIGLLTSETSPHPSLPWTADLPLGGDESAPPPWIVNARTRQEELCRTVEHLYGAIALLEARAEVREAELARAEHSAASSTAAAATLLRAQYETALSVKDSALRAAREQVSSLVSTLADMQGRVVQASLGEMPPPATTTSDGKTQKNGEPGNPGRPPGASPVSRGPTPPPLAQPPLYPLFPK